jgi:hypothetical protein
MAGSPSVIIGIDDGRTDPPFHGALPNSLTAHSSSSGSDAQHDLAALMRSAAKHLVGKASVFQGEHSPTSVTSFALSKSSVIVFSRAVVTST